jgi:cysteinyl-tRNA synthetase
MFNVGDKVVLRWWEDAMGHYSPYLIVWNVAHISKNGKYMTIEYFCNGDGNSRIKLIGSDHEKENPEDFVLWNGEKENV